MIRRLALVGGGFARPGILELDTTVVSAAKPDADPELGAYGRGGCRGITGTGVRRR